MTAPWWQGPLVGFDTETTGVDVETDRIVTACVVLVHPDGSVPEQGNTLIDPGVEIPAAATAVHGVTTEQARREGAAPADGISSLIERLNNMQQRGYPLVGFNLAFDLTLLDREARRYGIQPLEPTVVIDVLVLDKQLDRYRKGKRTLTAACEHYGVDLTNAHDAAADALAAVGLVRAMGVHAPFPPAEHLHAAQITWRAEQCGSLAQHFARQGKPQEVDGSWPVRPWREPATVGGAW